MAADSTTTLSDKRFNELRQLYIDCFETLFRLLVLVKGFEVIILHRKLEIPTKKGSMNLEQFEQLPNARRGPCWRRRSRSDSAALCWHSPGCVRRRGKSCQTLHVPSARVTSPEKGAADRDRGSLTTPAYSDLPGAFSAQTCCAPFSSTNRRRRPPQSGRGRIAVAGGPRGIRETRAGRRGADRAPRTSRSSTGICRRGCAAPSG